MVMLVLIGVRTVKQRSPMILIILLLGYAVVMIVVNLLLTNGDIVNGSLLLMVKTSKEQFQHAFSLVKKGTIMTSTLKRLGIRVVTRMMT